MKKSLLAVLCLAALSFAACDDEESNKGKDDCGDCGAGNACVEVIAGQGKQCVATCTTKGEKVKTCTEAGNDDFAYTNVSECDYATDNKTLVWIGLPSAALCDSKSCNAAKTDCGTAAEPQPDNGDCGDCGAGNACVEVIAGQGKQCVATCTTKGEKVKTCTESDDGDVAYTNVSECDYATDNKTLVWVGLLGAALCDYPACNAAGNDCGSEEETKAKLCFEDNESICEDNYVCSLAYIETLISPLCVAPNDNTCTEAGKDVVKCDSVNGKDAVSTTSCYHGAGSDYNKILGFTSYEVCEDNQECQVSNGKPACVKKSEPVNPDKGCGDDFVASCGAAGATHSCINGKVVDYTYSNPIGMTCHVFEEAQLATYIIETPCTVLEMPKESCIDVSGYAAYTKQVCGKAENGSYYWYTAAAQQCTNGCDDDGKKCK